MNTRRLLPVLLLALSMLFTLAACDSGNGTNTQDDGINSPAGPGNTNPNEGVPTDSGDGLESTPAPGGNVPDTGTGSEENPMPGGDEEMGGDPPAAEATAVP